MKLLFITRRVDRADALAGFTFAWVDAFARQVDELYVICLEKGDISGLPHNCTVLSLGKEAGKNRFREFVRFHGFARGYCKRADGVFTHQNPEYGILIAPWCFLYRKKLISWYTHKKISWKLRLLEKCASRIVTASPESFRLPSSKLTVLHHGIDTEHFAPEARKKSEHMTLLSISRISPSKNIDQIIELLFELKTRGFPDLQLDIVGDYRAARSTDYYKRLRSLVEQYKLTDAVHFKGPIPYRMTPSVYQNADLFLNFSATGSLDKAVLEAMSCELPVVVTNEAFKNILPAIDTRLYASSREEAVAKAELVLRDTQTGTLGRKEREYVVQNHDLHSLVTEILALYGTR